MTLTTTSGTSDRGRGHEMQVRDLRSRTFIRGTLPPPENPDLRVKVLHLVSMHWT